MPSQDSATGITLGGVDTAEGPRRLGPTVGGSARV